MPKPTNPQGVQKVPTVSYNDEDTIVELVYDPKGKTTALAVSRFGGLWNLENEVRANLRHLLVPYTPDNNLIASRCVLLPSKPIEYGFHHELVEDIRDFLHRYVDLSPTFELIAAHYILLTWVHDRFNEVPYLRLRGEYGTGKTRALNVLGALSYKGFFASGASTVSPIFHTLDAFGGTLVLDEADLPFSDARVEFVKILNNGHARGLPVLRSVQNRQKEFNPVAFRVFGPKIVAMRERFQDQALESRFITEEMGTRPLRPDIPVQLPSGFAEEALALRNRLLHYRLCEFFKISADLSMVMRGVEPRLNQIALPLLSMVKETETLLLIQNALIEQYDKMLAQRRDTAEGDVIAATLIAMAVPGEEAASVGSITKQLNDMQNNDKKDKKSSKWVGYILRSRLGIASVRHRGVYVVPASEKAKIDALAHRYGVIGAVR